LEPGEELLAAYPPPFGENWEESYEKEMQYRRKKDTVGECLYFDAKKFVMKSFVHYTIALS
jgi:hypothetical protein